MCRSIEVVCLCACLIRMPELEHTMDTMYYGRRKDLVRNCPEGRAYMYNSWMSMACMLSEQAASSCNAKYTAYTRHHVAECCLPSADAICRAEDEVRIALCMEARSRVLKRLQSWSWQLRQASCLKSELVDRCLFACPSL